MNPLNLPDYQVKPALVLDFDGTIRRSKSGATFIKDRADIEMMPGVDELIYEYKKAGFLIIGLTNQGGVAHGFKTLDDIYSEIEATKALFREGTFDYVAFSPFEEKGTVFPYNHRSLVRKPYYGGLAFIEMVFFENSRVVVDWDSSLFVGDRSEDCECATQAGVEFMHIDEFLKIK